VMDIFAPRTMTSTHTGNPVCCAAALAAIDRIVDGGLVAHSREMQKVLVAGLDLVLERFSSVVGALHCRGMVAALLVTKPGSTEPDPEAAFRVVERAFEKGLLMFSPVGTGAASVKIAPPLVTPAEALAEGCAVLAEAFEEALQ